MEGLKEKKYLKSTRKPFDPIALVLSLFGLAAVVYGVGYGNDLESFMNTKGMLVVIGGTFASILFQFDFSSCWSSIVIIFKSFAGTPEKDVRKNMAAVDKAIKRGQSITELKSARAINGNIINDVIFMHQKGLLFDEIDAFITSKIKDEILNRNIAVSLLKKAAMISPALGLFGTVIGLVGVLNSLTEPSQIGPSMSLALMTTAYGAGLSSLVFHPLAGRLEHHNEIYLETHSQLLSKIGVLLNRDERRFDVDLVEPEVTGVAS